MANVASSQDLRAPSPAVLGTVFGRVGGRTVIPRDLHGVVTRALSAARSAGRDSMGQTEAAAQAVVAVRPDLSLHDAVLAVDWLRDHG